MYSLSAWFNWSNLSSQHWRVSTYIKLSVVSILMEGHRVILVWLTFQQGATFGRRPGFNSWSLDIERKRSGKRGFSVSSPQLWNLLPADIRLLHNDHQLFRKRLKTHYMQQSMLCHWESMSTAWTLLLLCQLCMQGCPSEVPQHRTDNLWNYYY